MHVGHFKLICKRMARLGLSKPIVLQETMCFEIKMNNEECHQIKRTHSPIQADHHEIEYRSGAEEHVKHEEYVTNCFAKCPTPVCDLKLCMKPTLPLTNFRVTFKWSQNCLQ